MNAPSWNRSIDVTVKDRILAIVGPPTDVEAAKLWGRKSGLREMAHALGGGQCLPDLPPVEKDVSLRNAVKDEVRRARRLNAPRSSRSQAGTTQADRRRAS